MLESFFEYPKVLARLRRGPLVNDIDMIASGLARQGYARLSIVRYLSLIGSFSRYAEARGCADARAIDQALVEQFLAVRPTSSSMRSQARTALSHVCRHLVVRYPPKEEAGTAVDPDARLLNDFDSYLDEVRGLQEKSRKAVVYHARQMLVWYRWNRSGRALSELSAEDMFAFVAHLTGGCSARATRSAGVSHVRNFLRYLRWEGIVHEDFARLVPRTPCWRMARVPSYLEWKEIRRVIDAIDVTDPIGLRDRAMLLLLATTGLRSGELRRLRLCDVCWRSSEIRLPVTKRRREHRVPLLEEPGSALADYVLRGRPATTDTTVFLCHRPPVRPLRGASTLSAIVRRRLAHCGINPTRAGAHLLRHSLATRMVQEACPVKEVADLLGHHSIDVTAVYIKVALPQLADVALPFPGGEV